MARDGKRKVKSRASTKYATSSDEENSSDDEDNLLALFANLDMQQQEKINELIEAIHKKDELLDSQEDFLIKENKKHVKVKNAYAQEVEKCEKLTNELSTCHDVISNLRNESAKLIAKVESSNVCDDSIVSLKNDNANLIAKIDKLNASLSSFKIENEKLIAKAKELNVCNVSISNLRDENAILHAKIVELNTNKPSTSTVEHCWGEGEDATLRSMPSPISPHQRSQSDRQFPPFVQHSARRRPTTRSPRLVASSNTKAHMEFGPL
jgi:chromosome segregation ATPase